MNIDVLKELNNTHFFENNEYFIRYINLIEKNIPNKKNKNFNYQRHHIVPKCFYTQNNYNYSNKLDRLYINRKDNIVLLSYSDHILAHYYLCLCAKEPIFLYRLRIAFILLTNCDVNCFDLNSLEKYNEIYNKYLEDKNGRIRVNNGIDECVILKSELEKYLSSGYKQGRLNPTTKNKKGMNKDGIYILVQADDIYDLLNEGWKLGGLPYSQQEKLLREKLKKARHKKVCVSKNDVTKKIALSELDQYINNGWVKKGAPKSDSMKQKLKQYYKTHHVKGPVKDKIIVSKGGQNKYICLTELEQYLNQGWQKQKLKTKNKNVYIFMINTDGNNIKVKIENRQKYEDKGCKFIREIVK